MSVAYKISVKDILPENDIEPVEYKGLENYSLDKAKNLTEKERKALLVCLAYDKAFTLFKREIRRRKPKKLYYIYDLTNKMGKLGSMSITRLPLFIARNINVGETLNLFKSSTCLKNFRYPMTIFLSITDLASTIAYLTLRYAKDIVLFKEAYLKIDRSKLALLNYKLRRKTYENKIKQDPFTTAITRCMARLVDEHNKRLWYFTSDVIQYLKNETISIVLGDGEKNETIIMGYDNAGCPSRSLTIIDGKNLYIAHASDIA